MRAIGMVRILSSDSCEAESVNKRHSAKITRSRQCCSAFTVACTLTDVTAQTVTCGRARRCTLDCDQELFAERAQVRVMIGIVEFVGIPHLFECGEFSREPCAIASARVTSSGLRFVVDQG